MHFIIICFGNQNIYFGDQKQSATIICIHRIRNTWLFHRFHFHRLVHGPRIADEQEERIVFCIECDNKPYQLGLQALLAKTKRILKNQGGLSWPTWIHGCVSQNSCSIHQAFEVLEWCYSERKSAEHVQLESCTMDRLWQYEIWKEASNKVVLPLLGINQWLAYSEYGSLLKNHFMWHFDDNQLLWLSILLVLSVVSFKSVLLLLLCWFDLLESPLFRAYWGSRNMGSLRFPSSFQCCIDELSQRTNERTTERTNERVNKAFTERLCRFKSR